MREIEYKYEKFELKIKIPKEIELFMKAANISEKEVLDKYFWQMQAEDSVFFSHEKHPTEEGYVSHDFESDALTKSKKISVLIHGVYISSKKLFELDPEDFIKEEILVTSSCNIKNAVRIYFSFYD